MLELDIKLTWLVLNRFLFSITNYMLTLEKHADINDTIKGVHYFPFLSNII